MSAIPRKTQLVFGASLTPSGNVAEFGSLAAGTPAYSDDPAIIQSAAWLNGMAAALVGNKSPALQDLNGILMVITKQLAYLLQSGIPEWDAGTTYYTNDFCRVAGSIYVSLTDTNLNNNPATDTTNWIPLTSQMKGPTVCRAWVVFDGINATGGNARLISAFNVDHVVKNAAGSYTIHFSAAMPGGNNYALSGSCGTENASPAGPGDSGVVVGNVYPGDPGLRSGTDCKVFTIDPSTKALVQSGCVSVFFFG